MNYPIPIHHRAFGYVLLFIAFLMWVLMVTANVIGDWGRSVGDWWWMKLGQRVRLWRASWIVIGLALFVEWAAVATSMVQTHPYVADTMNYVAAVVWAVVLI